MSCMCIGVTLNMHVFSAILERNTNSRYKCTPRINIYFGFFFTSHQMIKTSILVEMIMKNPKKVHKMYRG